jgi:cysteine synthase A
MGMAVISDAEKKGVLKPGSIIVETTAGNAGIGLALAAIGKGYKIIFCVPEKFSREKQQIMRALGAEIINTPYEEGMEGAFKKSREIAAAYKNTVRIDQFKELANPKAYLAAGKEIYDDLGGQIDYIVAGAGSGGTISGISKYLKLKNPEIKSVLADPEGSTMAGVGAAGCYKVEGIGNTFVPETFDKSLIDEIIKTNDEEAFGEVKKLARNEGILAGSSSGAALSAVRKLTEKIKSGNIAVVLPDRGDRYLSKDIYK